MGGTQGALEWGSFKMLQGDEDEDVMGWPGVEISIFWHSLSVSLHITELEMVLPFSFLLQSPGSFYPATLLLCLGKVLDPAAGYFISCKQHVTPAVLKKHVF